MLLAAAVTAGALATSALAHPSAAPTCFGESGYDIVDTSNDETLVGTPGPDRIYGGRRLGIDTLDGQDGTTRA